MQSTRAIIYLNHLRQNIEAARKKAGPHPKICFPVKADGYGHGAVQLSDCALKAGADYLAVSSLLEGRELRLAGFKAPILVLAQALPIELKEIISLELIPIVSDDGFIEEAGKAAMEMKKTLAMHLKIDTGMGRLGCFPGEAPKLAAKIASHKWLSLGGTATHLSVSDSISPENITYTKEQLSLFKKAVSSIKEAGVDPGLLHAANSGALVFHEDSYFDMIRPGLFLYGYSPNKSSASLVKPVMELRSPVVSIKKIKKGDSASYGNTWQAKADTFLGVISLGYADGLPWQLSNNHSVSIRGKAYPLVGRICMDQIIVDLGKDPEVQRWDEAIIFGPNFITAADMAEKLSSLPYEITCGINKRVPREYVYCE